MKIGIDLDDVVADFFPSFVRFYNKKYGKNFQIRDITSYWIWEVGIGGNKREAIALVDEFHNSPEFDEIPPVQGAREGLVKLTKSSSGLYIITSRPLRFQEKTNRFLQKHFSEFPLTTYYSNDFHNNDNEFKKAEICRRLKLDVYIEDHLPYAQSCAEAGVPVLLLDKPWNQNGVFPDNLTRVYNWLEIVKSIKQRKETKNALSS